MLFTASRLAIIPASLTQTLNPRLWPCLLLGIALLCAQASACELPDGDTDGDECITQNTAKNFGGANPDCAITPACVADPINIAIGNKYEKELDYASNSPLPLLLARYYNSLDGTLTTLGSGWRSSYSRTISSVSASSVNASRDDGKVLAFTLNNGVWKPDSDINATLAQTATGWRYINGLDETETYNTAGQLIGVANRAGLTQTLSYDSSGHLSTVSDAFGRQLSFAYTGAFLSTVTVPDGSLYRYGYDNHNNLISITYPDQSLRTFLYENTGYPHALTGVIDELGNRFATDAYDSSGRDISTQNANGVNLYRLNFGDLAYGDVPVVDVLNTTRTAYFTSINGTAAETRLQQSCPSCTTNSTTERAVSYDANGNILTRTDFNGNLITYTYDTRRNLELSRVEAAGTALARTITTTWSSNWRLPVQITEPNRTTTFRYDGSGNLLQKTVSSANLTRTWTFTYNRWGEPLTLDGPRTDVSDITHFGYDSQGNLASITDALGHSSAITSDANGRPLTLRDPNNLVTTFIWTARGRRHPLCPIQRT